MRFNIDKNDKNGKMIIRTRQREGLGWTTAIHRFVKTDYGN